MKKYLISIFTALIVPLMPCMAGESYEVTVVYDGETAAVTIPSGLSNYVSCSSGTSSHVQLVQASTVGDNTTGEIIYTLKGNSNDGEFYLDGKFKATIQLSGLTLTNPNGPALNIQNGKRIAISAKKDTENTLTDGTNEDYNGCIHSKGHTEFKGKGTLNVTGNSKHAIYSKEYVQVKNLTINVLSAVKDGIHCKEYFLMENGTLTINGAQDDGIQVELDGTTSTGILGEHEDEDSGNFYMEDGSLFIGECQGKAIKADGNVYFYGGTKSVVGEIQENAVSTGIITIRQNQAEGKYDLHGHRLPNGVEPKKGLYIVRKEGRTMKVVVK